MCVAACFYSTILHNMFHCILVGCPVAANNLTDYPIVLALGGSFEVEKLDEEVDIDMDRASLIEMFHTSVSETLAFHDFSIVS